MGSEMCIRDSYQARRTDLPIMNVYRLINKTHDYFYRTEDGVLWKIRNMMIVKDPDTTIEDQGHEDDILCEAGGIPELWMLS